MDSIPKLSKQHFCVVFLTSVIVFCGVSYLNISNYTRYDLLKNQRTMEEEIRNTRKESKEKNNITDDNTNSKDVKGDNIEKISYKSYTRSQNPNYDTSRNQGDANTRGRLESLLILSDYTKYPCLPGYNQSDRPRPLNRCIRTVNVQLVADTVLSVECVKLNIDTTVPICIHDPRIDIYVSGSIFATGAWEKELLKIFMDALNKVKDIVVLDIGCNIGVYTLVAAREGKRVISIDANIQNLRLLSKSLILGQLTENVTLIWNALSDTYTNVTLNSNQYNIGGFSVNTDNKSKSGDDVIIETILLDDLMHLFEGKPVGIKMDVELFELHVLKGGVTFIKNIDIRFIQIEIVHHRSRRSGQGITILLRYFGFTPFANCLGDRNLVDVPVNDWPGDVCFIKNTKNTFDAD